MTTRFALYHYRNSPLVGGGLDVPLGVVVEDNSSYERIVAAVGVARVDLDALQNVGAAFRAEIERAKAARGRGGSFLDDLVRANDQSTLRWDRPIPVLRGREDLLTLALRLCNNQVVDRLPHRADGYTSVVLQFTL